jgi:hypothetical protein
MQEILILKIKNILIIIWICGIIIVILVTS